MLNVGILTADFTSHSLTGWINRDTTRRKNNGNVRVVGRAYKKFITRGRMCCQR